MAQHQYFGTVYMCKEAWPHLKAARHGCIVNTASEAITGFVPKDAGYSGAKGAVYSFTRALALEGRRYGLRANALAPRGNTRMSSAEELSKFYEQPAEVFKTPFMEAMLPEYTSPAVAYLAHESCPLTGETLICGGLSVHRLAVVQSRGVTLTGTISPEDVRDNIGTILDLTDPVLRDLDNPPV